jgi:hypothetical protein
MIMSKSNQALTAVGVLDPVDSLGIPMSCGKPLCSPGNHHPLCKLAIPTATQQPPVQVTRAFVNFDVLTQWMGSALGITGALLLAMNTPWSAYGWVSFLLSNFAWILFAYRNRVWSMLVMQLVFTGTSVLGIYRWILMA